MSRLASSTSTSTRASTPLQRPNAKAGPSTPPRAASGTASKTSSPSKLVPTSRQVSSSSITGTARPPSAASQIGRAPSAASAAPAPSRAATPQETQRTVSSSTQGDMLPPPSPSLTEASLPKTPPRQTTTQTRPGAMRSMSSAISAFQAMPPPPPPNRAGSPIKRAETPDQESAGAVFGQKRELDELRIKVRLLESRRAEDQDRIKSMEARAAEADTLRAARVKLQGTSRSPQSEKWGALTL